MSRLYQWHCLIYVGHTLTLRTSRPRHESATDVHVGRGGAANTVHIPAEEIEVTNRDKRKLEPTVTRVSQTNTQDESTARNADKAVNWIKGKLNLNKGNKPAAA